MTQQELMMPPTELEVAELLRAANTRNHTLTVAAVCILRRLAYDRNRLKYRLNHQTEDDMELCRQGKHKDCGA